MTSAAAVMAILCAGSAALLACGAPAGRVARRRLATADTDPVLDGAGQPQQKWQFRFFVLALPVGLVVLAGLMLGTQALALTVAAVVIGGTMTTLVRKSTRRRRAATQRAAVTQACTMLAAQVRVGQIPLDALRSVAEDSPMMKPAINTADLGGDVVQQWRRQAAEPGQSGLADLARAWQLSLSTGASMTNSLDDLAEALNDDETLDLVIKSEAAGPRASGKIMAVLPFIAMGMGYLLGGDPVGFLFGSPLGWACLICGCVFACGGMLWMERVADHVMAAA